MPDKNNRRKYDEAEGNIVLMQVKHIFSIIVIILGSVIGVAFGGYIFLYADVSENNNKPTMEKVILKIDETIEAYTPEEQLNLKFKNLHDRLDSDAKIQATRDLHVDGQFEQVLDGIEELKKKE
jgi:hypothetical protein